jgi:hypothetical protein
MNSRAQKYLLYGVFVILLILSAYKYYNNFTITAPEAASTVLREVANENRVFEISEEQMEDIRILYKSVEEHNLPHIEITRFVPQTKDNNLERVIFTKDLEADRWIIVPRRMGDTDASYVERNCRGHYLLQDIQLESVQKGQQENLYVVTARINYSEFFNRDMRRSYASSVTFILKRLSINQWKVEAVRVQPFIAENNF